MALEFAHGGVLWAAADAPTTTYTISGLPFQPKALRFYVLGRGTATDSGGSTHLRQCVGFAVSTSSRRAVATYSQHAAGTTICTSGYRDDCVVLTVDGGPAASGLLDLNSITSDGFTLIVDDQAPADVAVFWEAWGGDDITVAALVDIAEPAATGNVDYTVSGFTSGATDQVVLFAGTQTTGASPSAVRADGGICMGAASGPDAANNIVMAGNQDDASPSADTDRYIRDGECLAMIALAGGNPSARAQLTQFGTDNFRLNWAARATTNRRYIALAIKGGQWVVGSTTINATSLSATATVSGLPFAPIGVSLMSGLSTEDSAGTSAVEDKKSMGSGSSTSSRRAQGCWDENGPTTSDINLAVDYDGILVVPTAAAGIDCIIDLSQMNSDGFQLIVDDAGASVSSTAWVGYLTFGSEPTVTQITPTVGLLTLVGIAATIAVPVSITPAVGALTASGNQPTQAHALTPQVGALVLTGQAASVALAIPITPDVGALTLVGELAVGVNIRVLNPSVGNLGLNGTSPPQMWTNSPAAGALVLTGQPAVVQTLITPAAGSLTLTGSTPITLAFRSPDTGALVLTGETPQVRHTTLITPASGAMTLTGNQPEFGGGASITPATGSLTLTGELARIQTSIVPASGTLTLNGNQVTLRVEITPNTGALILTGELARIQTNIVPTSGSLALTGNQPVLHFATFITPATGDLTLTGQTPQFPGGVTPETGTLSLTGQTPTLFYPNITPAAGALVLTGASPQLVVSIIPATGALNLTGEQASLRVDITPAAGALNLTGGAAVTLRVEIIPNTGTLTLTGQQVPSGGDEAITPNAGALTLTGVQAVRRVETQITPNTGVLVLSGNQPVIRSVRFITPNRGTLLLTGAAPTIPGSGTVDVSVTIRGQVEVGIIIRGQVEIAVTMEAP